MPTYEPSILVRPGPEHLPGYAAALETGWSPNTTRPEVAREELENLAKDSDAVLRRFDDPDAKGPPITLTDGSSVKRLPSITRFIWDGQFCGNISLRWQGGTADLPSFCLGHIGYSVVPWKQRRGYATRGLREILVQAGELGLPYVVLAADTTNIASQNVILKCGGEIVHGFQPEANNESTEHELYRIKLT
ncbi:MAG: GNAT family N-acetyltransferase [Paracoccaceae bacterium]